jgi:hypothetical protein
MNYRNWVRRHVEFNILYFYFPEMSKTFSRTCLEFFLAEVYFSKHRMLNIYTGSAPLTRRFAGRPVTRKAHKKRANINSYSVWLGEGTIGNG